MLLRNVAKEIKDTYDKKVVVGIIHSKRKMIGLLGNMGVYEYNAKAFITEGKKETDIPVKCLICMALNREYECNELLRYGMSMINNPYAYNTLLNAYCESMLLIKRLEYINRKYRNMRNNELPENESNIVSVRRQFTLSELSKYTGRDGNPAYVAVNGTVYDVTGAPAWQGGTHFRLLAGKDLTGEFQGCHSDISVLKGVPVAGTIIG
jgi:Predicted heme/steroid binding protein